MRWPDVDIAIVRAIAEAVEAEGGDYSDVEDLIDTYERIHVERAVETARAAKTAQPREQEWRS